MTSATVIKFFRRYALSWTPPIYLSSVFRDAFTDCLHVRLGQVIIMGFPLIQPVWSKLVKIVLYFVPQSFQRRILYNGVKRPLNALEAAWLLSCLQTIPILIRPKELHLNALFKVFRWGIEEKIQALMLCGGSKFLLQSHLSNTGGEKEYTA